MYSARLESAIQHPESNEWVRRFAKIGYAVKGVVYALIGVLALGVAGGRGGKLAGEHEAVEHVQGLPFGDLGLVVIGVGLAGYALFRALEGILDVRRVGSGPTGIFKRIGYVASALINGAVAVTAFQLVTGGQAHQDKTWVTRLMQEPAGLAVLGILGAGVCVAGVVQIYVGYARRFLDEVRLNEARPEVRRWMEPLGRIGHAARGLVFLVCGAGLVRAALTTNPRRAKTFGEALGEIASQPFGLILLGFVAAGLLAYGAFLVVTVKYRKLGAI